MRSGSPSLGVSLVGSFSLGEEISVSASSSALSWISPRPMTPVVSEVEREKGGGAVGDKRVEGQVGTRIGSIDRKEEAGLSESHVDLGGLEDKRVSRSEVGCSAVGRV